MQPVSRNLSRLVVQFPISPDYFVINLCLGQKMLDIAP
jgi:hypothetical protein